MTQAYEEGLVCRTVITSADFSAKQFYGITHAGAVCGDDGECFGIVQNKPASGKLATVAVGGVSRVVLGGTVAAGALVNIDTNGKVVAVASGDNHSIGICRVGGDANEIGSVEIRFQSIAGRVGLD